eukprot:CAMPEP_0116829436 /NCGR_PEP_ID=MMETSP0418-20121206/4211_1 /TAXON_ID=1158023 /ORGANISM="Astrosyne radiata, Strain 13vi08-1A" /LENGTH=114 /DNA_ID=CAMNT_0004458437 /DNA_START=911 /DNA_END=1255 /DNA_ORIENTATION=-
MNVVNALSTASSNDAAINARDFIGDETSSHKVVIFSKSYCPYCRATKALLRGVEDVVVHELDQMHTGSLIQSELLRLTGQRTVPSVWVNGQHLGGNDDTQAAARSGKLQQMLEA